MILQKTLPLHTVQRLVSERYEGAKAVFWAGSVALGQETPTSDLDLVVVFDSIPHAYREAFTYNEWPVDVFVHDFETLSYFYHVVDFPSFMPALPSMIAYGVIVQQESGLGKLLQEQALELLQEKIQLDHSSLLNRRFHITDSLDDLKASKEHEFMATKYSLYSKLCEFYLLANGYYIGTGKQLVKQLKSVNLEIADYFYHVFSKNNVEEIETCVMQILKPFGGPVWDGFRLNAPHEWRENILGEYECKNL